MHAVCRLKGDKSTFQGTTAGRIRGSAQTGMPASRHASSLASHGRNHRLPTSPGGRVAAGNGATKRVKRRGLGRCSCAHGDDRIRWLCHGDGYATVPVYYFVHVYSQRIRKTWYASWGGGMDAIYSATALRDHPCEVKQAVRRGLVRITENGDATCSAQRMYSSARWPRPRSERSMRSMFRRQSYADAWTLRRAIALRASMRQRAPSHRGARRDCPTMVRLILTNFFLVEDMLPNVPHSRRMSDVFPHQAHIQGVTSATGPSR